MWHRSLLRISHLKTSCHLKSQSTRPAKILSYAFLLSFASFFLVIGHHKALIVIKVKLTLKWQYWSSRFLSYLFFLTIELTFAELSLFSHSNMSPWFSHLLVKPIQGALNLFVRLYWTFMKQQPCVAPNRNKTSITYLWNISGISAKNIR